MTRFRYDEQTRGLARTAYKTLEPLHLLAYFGPHVDATRERLGVGWLGSYTGMRAAPLGDVPAEVVTACFYGFSPSAVTKAWGLVRAHHSLAEVNAVRTETVRAGLADAAAHREVPDPAPVAARLREVVSALDPAGRALAASFLALPWPEDPWESLWHATAIWREWRGDGHNAVLAAHGLAPVEALALYDAYQQHDPSRKLYGRTFLQPTRKWTDEEWEAATDALVREGLVRRTDDGPVTTDEGTALRAEIEDRTDDASAAVWVGVPDAADLLASFRPYSKAVIDLGYLPGTTRK